MIRTPQGKWEKENPDVLQKLEASVVTYKLAIRRAEVLSTLKDSPGWETIKEILKEKAESLARKRRAFYSASNKKESSEMYLDQRQMDLLLQQEADFDFLANIVDDYTQSISGFQSALERSEKDLNARKSSVETGK